jgi:hypothetical protein
MSNSGDISIIKEFTDILESLGIRYAIGGSVASSIYGKVRFTADADVSVFPFTENKEKLCELLSKDFYISEQAVVEALNSRTSFNIIHLETAFKIDVFVLKSDDFEKNILPRSNNIRLSGDVESNFSVVSPEDIILIKLRWYNDSGCVSDRQLQDVVGVLRVQNQNLDYQYLETWAKNLGLGKLLKQAIEQVNSE